MRNYYDTCARIQNISDRRIYYSRVAVIRFTILNHIAYRDAKMTGTINIGMIM